jgi:hypothetical protein
LYHVRVSTHSNISHDETKIDLDEAELREQFLEPYEQGRPIVVNGRTIPITDLARIRISSADVPSETLRRQVEAEERASSVLVLGGPPTDWKIASKGRDVTDQFIKGPPGSAAPSGRPERQSAPRKVFIAHSGDTWALNRLLRFIRALGPDPQIAEWLPFSGTQVPEHVRRVFSDCECAVVFAEATQSIGGSSQPGRGVLIEVGLLQQHFGDRIVYLREEGASFGPMADPFAAEFFRQDCLENAFFRLVVEFKAWSLI